MDYDNITKEHLIEELEEAKCKLEEQDILIANLKIKNDQNNIYSLIFDSARDSMIVTDPEGTILDWNKACETMFGYSKEEAIGNTPLLVHNPKFAAAKTKEILDSLDTDGKWTGEVEIVKKDGSFGICESSVMPIIKDGKMVGTIGINREISTRKAFEKALIESEEKFRKAIELSPSAIFIVTIDQKFIYVNKAFIDLMGFSKEESYHLKANEVVHPDMRDLVMSRYKIRIEGNQAPARYEMKCLTKDKKDIWVDFSITDIEYQGERVFLTISNDITDLKQAQQMLVESEEKWRTLAENLPDYIMTMKKDGTILAVNQTVVSTSVNAIIGTNIYDFVAKEYLETVKKEIDIVFETGRPNIYETKGLGNDGQLTTWYEVRVVPLFADKVIDRVMTISKNITERKNYEEELKKWAHIFEHTQLGVVICHSKEMAFDLINPAFVKMHGYAVEDLLGMTMYDIFSDKPEIDISKQLSVLNEKGYHTFEAYHKRKDGSCFPALINITAVKDEYGKVMYHAINVLDITDRKIAEEEVNVFFSTTLDMLCIADFNGYFKKLSPTWTHHLGWTEEELQAKPFIDFVHKDDRLLTARAAAKMKNGSDIIGFENRYLCKNGEYKWIAWNARSLKERDMIIAAARDITQWKNTESQILQLNSELEDRVVERTHELEKAYTKLEQALEKEKKYNDMQSRFINTISHEYRTPLTVISSSVELIRLFKENNDFEGIEKYLSKINYSVSALTNMVEDVFAFSGNEHGKIVLNLSPIEIIAFTEQTYREIQTTDKAEHIINFNHNKEHLTVMIDRMKYRQILIHLISNAMKFSPDQSVIDLRVEHTDSNIILTVQDRGIGIPEEDKKHLFEPFFKNKDLIGIKSGTGLGLPVVKKYIEAFDGTITIDSTVGRGTSIICTIPRVNAMNF